MKWYNNLKIKLKFAISFGLLTVLVAGMGISGVINTKEIEKQEIRMHNNLTVPLKQLAELINHFQRMKVQSRDILMVESDLDIASSVKKINTYINGTHEILPDIKKHVSGTPLEQMFASYEEKFVIYESNLKNLTKLIQKKQLAEGSALLRGDVYISARETQVILENLLITMSALMDNTFSENISNTTSSINTLIVFVIIGICLALFLSIYTARTFTKRITIITNAINSLKSNIIINLTEGAERLARADLDLKIPRNVEMLTNDSKDEIGVLSDNVNEIISMLLSTVDSVEKSVHNIREMVQETNRFAHSASTGLLHYRCNSDKFEGGFRNMVQGLNNTINAFAEPMQEAREVLEQVADGNLTVSMKGVYLGDYNLLEESINELIISLNETISEVENAVLSTAEAGSNIEANAEHMANGTQEQDRQANEAVIAVGMMEDVVSDLTRSAAIAAEASRNAREIAKDGSESLIKTVEGMSRVANVVGQAVEQVKELSKSNMQIGEIVSVINDIADQTNLLALNAAIEAARAGEQGRGFAIVADEVRKLAERTTKATKEIDGMIKRIQSDTNSAIGSIHTGAAEAVRGKVQANSTGQAMEKIMESALKVSSVVDQVAAASEEQLSALHEMRRNIEIISDVSHSSNRDIMELKQAAGGLNSLTTNLQALVNRFQIDAKTIRNKNKAMQIRLR